MTRGERLAYLAGLVDGEGTITIGRTRGGRVEWRYQPRLLLVNTDLRLITACREILGFGFVYQSRADRAGRIPANWNPVHRFQCVASQARDAIALLRPYLVAKADHADIVLDMPVRSRNSYDLSAIDAQAAAFASIRELNRRGRHGVGAVDVN